MDAFEKLLRGSTSELQRLMRASLCGLTTTLETALESLPGDPAAALGRNCLEELRRILQAPENTSEVLDGGAGQTSEPATDPRPSAQQDWLDLAEEWQGSAEWQATFGNSLTSSVSTMPARELWLLTLRASPDQAEKWQEGWFRMRGAVPASTTTELLAGPVEHILLPATQDVPVEVRFSPLGRVPDVLSSPSPGKLAEAMILPVAACLGWMEHDRLLHHMLRNLFRFGTMALTDGHRSRFQNSLVERFQQLTEAESEGDAAQVVLAWVALDEAIHSLLHLPPATPQSAFAAVGRASRSRIAAVRDFAYAAGVEAHLQILAGRYANLRGNTDPEADVETSEGGAPGDVVLCSRLFLRLNGKTYPGRVLYRPR